MMGIYIYIYIYMERERERERVRECAHVWCACVGGWVGACVGVGVCVWGGDMCMHTF